MPSQLRSVVALLPALCLAAPILDVRSPTAIQPRQGWGSVSSSTGLSFYNADFSAGTSGKADPSEYTCYSGPASEFPAMDTWISFDNMWQLMTQDVLTPIGDSASEQSDMLTAITEVAHRAKVDPRVILAGIVGESSGNVRVGCTNNGVENCGLMQSHAPTDTAFDPSDALLSIKHMVRDGVQGTAAGPGLVQLFNDEQLTGGNLWQVYRAYNSGSIDYADLSNPMGATAAYVSNMANFLTGWNGWGAGSAWCGFA